MSKDNDLKVAIITGASSGIGEATARLLSRHGYAVVLGARRKDRLEVLQAEIAEAGGTALAVAVDVTDREAVEGMAQQALKAFGRIDILVNNAGIMPLSPIRALKVDEWDRMIDVNVKGLLYCVAAVLPTMLEQEDGHIINVSSVAGRRPFQNGVIYSSTKFAVRAISQGLRLELSPEDKIRVTDIEPGVVATELTHHITHEETAERFKANWANKKELDSEDVAEAIRWVAMQPEHVNVNELLVRPTDQPT
ncbi:MAG: SDR family oxidoreductase [Gemmatimonadota bacterium]|nr:SDR family oxidoreductase [Gemmatimonadota bacterium]